MSGAKNMKIPPLRLPSVNNEVSLLLKVRPAPWQGLRTEQINSNRFRPIRIGSLTPSTPHSRRGSTSQLRAKTKKTMSQKLISNQFTNPFHPTLTQKGDYRLIVCRAWTTPTSLKLSSGAKRKTVKPTIATKIPPALGEKNDLNSITKMIPSQTRLI